MERSGEILVRQARPEDVDAIVSLEKTVYGPLGTACYGEEYVRAWLEVHPPGLTVAVQDGAVVGYQYAQRVDFEFDRMHLFQKYDEATDHGCSRSSHRPDGNALHSVTLCSIIPGAGKALLDDLFELARRLNTRYTIGMARMPGLAAY